jgi:hypothetical protein
MASGRTSDADAGFGASGFGYGRLRSRRVCCEVSGPFGFRCQSQRRTSAL